MGGGGELYMFKILEILWVREVRRLNTGASERENWYTCEIFKLRRTEAAHVCEIMSYWGEEDMCAKYWRCWKGKLVLGVKCTRGRGKKIVYRWNLETTTGRNAWLKYTWKLVTMKRGIRVEYERRESGKCYMGWIWHVEWKKLYRRE